MAITREFRASELIARTLGEGKVEMALTEDKAALARLIEYCRTEASEMNLSFVVYCLSMASASLNEGMDGQAARSWDPSRRKRE